MKDPVPAIHTRFRLQLKKYYDEDIDVDDLVDMLEQLKREVMYWEQQRKNK